MGRRFAFVLAIAAAIVVAVPALATAGWTHKGKGELKENASVTLTGELTLATSAGNVSCPTTIGATLTASSSTGDVNSFTVSEPSKCDLTGSLGAICGTHGVTKVEKTGTWALAAETSDIAISSIDVHYVMTGCLIPGFRLKGSSTATLDKATAIGSATLSGTQTLYNALGEESGSGELEGTLAVSPAGTYGVKTAATVETRWLDGNSHLSKDGALTLSGTFSFSGTSGSVSCPSSVKLALESSTIEEEEPEGQIESFTVAKPSECDVGGTLGTLCGTHSVTGVEQTGTGTLITDEEDISTAGIVLDYKFSGCGVTTLRVEGSPTISVDDPSSISSATFSAGTLEIYNASGETTGTASAGGSVSASPSGTYQIASDAEETAETEETEETEETHEAKTITEIEDKPHPVTLKEDEWHTLVEIGEEEFEEVTLGTTTATGDTVVFRGSLTTTKFPLKQTCNEVTVHTTLWNPEHTVEVEEELVWEHAATGEVHSLTFDQLPCTVAVFNLEAGGYVDVPGCEITEFETGGFPWHVDVATGANGIAIIGANFTNTYNGCGALGIPNGAKLGFNGTLTGTWNSATHCIESSNSGDLKNAVEEFVLLDAVLCS